jgi:UDP-N-acetylmuramoyl-tripeptide--D-alanyl-D-alanine ligase
MNPVRLNEFAQWVRGTAFGEGEITGFAIDSREVQPGDLFVAIRGDRVDGHNFVEKALELGAIGSLVEQPVKGPYVLVPNVVEALADMARHYRDRFSGNVVGVTGSVGKTTTKEILAAALAHLGPVQKTEGNRNTEFTGPLLWPEIREETRSVVVEMGMRGPRQIAQLANFHKPTAGIITGIGTSHANMVKGREGIAWAKRELLEALPAGSPAVVCESDFPEILKVPGLDVLTYGYSGSGLAAEVIEVGTGLKPSARLRIGGEVVEGILPSPGEHIALNACGVLLMVQLLGGNLQDAFEAIGNCEIPGNRMAVREALGQTWILDMYNAAPDSMQANLKVARELANERPLVLVLGEMRELGDYAKSSHEKIGAMVADLHPELVLVYDGPDNSGAKVWLGEAALRSGLEAKRLIYPSSFAEGKEILSRLEGSKVVFVKGSRAVELENVLPEGVL